MVTEEPQGAGRLFATAPCQRDHQRIPVSQRDEDTLIGISKQGQREETRFEDPIGCGSCEISP